MGRLKKFALAIYLLANIVVVGGLAGLLFGPYTERFAQLFDKPVARIAVLVCLAIVAIYLLVTLVRIIVSRPEPEAARVGGDANIEVSVRAVESVARAAAADRDLMIEDVEAHVVGRDRGSVRVRVTAIAFINQGVEGLAFRLQQRVTEACDQMLGVPGTVVQVRFLPSKTTIVDKEFKEV